MYGEEIEIGSGLNGLTPERAAAIADKRYEDAQRWRREAAPAAGKLAASEKLPERIPAIDGKDIPGLPDLQDIRIIRMSVE